MILKMDICPLLMILVLFNQNIIDGKLKINRLIDENDLATEPHSIF